MHTKSIPSNDVKKASHEYPLVNELVYRYSPRMFDDQEISHQELMSLFKAARWAPSAFNIQPWHFIHGLKGSDGYEKIDNCLSDFNKSWVKYAPLLMLTVIEEKKEDGQENYHALHDLGITMGLLTVQAQHLGIVVHQMAGVDWNEAERKFNIPEDHHVVTGVGIGYYGRGPFSNT